MILSQYIQFQILFDHSRSEIVAILLMVIFIGLLDRRLILRCLLINADKNGYTDVGNVLMVTDLFYLIVLVTESFDVLNRSPTFAKIFR